MTPAITAVAPASAPATHRADPTDAGGEDFVDALRAQGGETNRSERTDPRPAVANRHDRDHGRKGPGAGAEPGQTEGEDDARRPSAERAGSADLELPTAAAVPAQPAATAVAPAASLSIPLELAAALAVAGEVAEDGAAAEPVDATAAGEGATATRPTTEAGALVDPAVAEPSVTVGTPSGDQLASVPEKDAAADTGSSGSPAAQVVPDVEPAADTQAAASAAASTTPAPAAAQPTVADVVGSAVGAASATAPTAPTSVAAPQPAAPTTPAHVPVPNQVAAAVSPLLRGADGSHQMTLHLSPEGLGRVNVHLTVAGDEVRMHLTAADAVTRELLRDGLPELRSQLEDAGLKATRLDVQTGGASTWGGPSSDRPAPDQRPELRPDRPRSTHGNGPPPPATAPPRPTTTDSRLDLRM